ncbi:hypothetical protein ABPG75_000522 [Micractinium tetrahymenae]
MKYSGGTVDDRAVKAAAGSVLEGGNGVRVGGWVISSHKGPITADAQLEGIKAELGTLAAPEQFYGENYLRLTHEASGTCISFTALDALKGWLSDKSEPVRVEAAADWLRSRQQDVQTHAAQTLEYDWTYTTSYPGTVGAAGSASEDGGISGGSGGGGGSGAQPAAAAAAAGSGGAAAAAGAAPDDQQQQGRQQQGQQRRWEPSGEAIPRALLTSRDPILYYDELPLYESELDDHGSSRMSLKVRVMPRCWYVLLRFWLRVDHVLVRLRETRVFCQFDSPPPPAARVLREVRHHEGTFADLRAAGAPAEGPAYADADTASAALMAVAPLGVTHYRQEQLLL